ncbi:hypothetical protein ARMGADRAFT_88988 [Armillaria gallica]|uniref:Uncharacterized protein n=1 Tax=Armillaria gallica TaxID=47427 RepID=A0A2H3DYQ3_ARMGA|nr:hypothetical protein ARMGADRAFT_88988 [Armillaria gallica]
MLASCLSMFRNVIQRRLNSSETRFVDFPSLTVRIYPQLKSIHCRLSPIRGRCSCGSPWMLCLCSLLICSISNIHLPHSQRAKAIL